MSEFRRPTRHRIHAFQPLARLHRFRAGVSALLLAAMALGAPRWFGAITPLGGTALIVAWLLFAIRAWRHGR